MIFGGIRLNSDKIISSVILKNIYKTLTWESAISDSFNHKTFSVSYLFDQRLPYSENDFYFFKEDTGILIFIDGFIYNKNEILKAISSEHREMGTPELIYHAFLKWGENFVEKLNGDFAICIYDEFSNKAFFYRDHVGIRPIAICKIDSVIYFATDIIGFSKALFEHEKIEPQYLLGKIFIDKSSYPILPNNKLIKVLPGNFISATENDFIKYKYWRPDTIKKNKKLNFETVKNEIEQLLRNAVKIRSDQRYLSSAHVSGGLDSGIVAALARNEYQSQSNFYGFSWSPEFSVESEHIEFDERNLIKAICDMNRITPVYSNFDSEDYLHSTTSWRYASELIFERKVVQSARERNVNLIFSGWGGDEFISIGGRGMDADLIKEFNWMTFLKKYPIKYPKNIINALLFNVLFPSSKRSFLKYTTYDSVYKYLYTNIPNYIPRKKRFSYGSRRKIHKQLLELNHLASRCEDWYVHGQRNGIEFRYPLIDKRIVEYMIKVPSKCLVDKNRNRILLREIGKHILPVEVLSHNSKNDPVKEYFLSFVGMDETKQFIEEMPKFKSNEDLNYFNFDLIEETIKIDKRNNVISDELSLIIHYVKQAHEFTKGYYN